MKIVTCFFMNYMILFIVLVFVTICEVHLHQSNSTMAMDSQGDRNKSYLIVEFPDETVDDATPEAIISSTWIIDPDADPVYCLWPGYFKNEVDRIKATIRHAKLNIKMCGQSKVNILYSTGDYQKAVAKLKHLETQSFVSQTEDESNETTKKRTKRARKYFEEYHIGDVDTDDELIPKPPPIKRKITATKTIERKVRSPLPVTQVTNSENEEEMGIIPTRINSLNTTPTNRMSPQPNSSSSTVTVSPYQTPSVSSRSSVCSNCEQNNGYIKNILINLQKIKEDMQYLISVNVNHKNNGHEELITTKINQCNTKEELEHFNSQMGEMNKMLSAVATLQVLGGKDLTDSTYRILTKIVSHELSLQYNWSGKNGKNSFASLVNIIKLLTVTVRKNPFARNATSKEVEDIIKIWFRNAGDRQGGRTKRKSKNLDRLKM